MINILNNIDEIVKKYNNNYMSTLLIIFFVIYLSINLKKLSINLLELVNNYTVKLLVFLLIIYIANKNILSGIILIVIVFIIFVQLKDDKTEKENFVRINSESQEKQIYLKDIEPKKIMSNIKSQKNSNSKKIKKLRFMIDQQYFYPNHN
jgi:hypothetical protein